MSNRPPKTLIRWNVIRAQTREGYIIDHVVGYCSSSRTGEVSSLLEKFDPVSRLVLDYSGQVFLLKGPPEYDPEGFKIWVTHWQQMGFSQLREVTKEYNRVIRETAEAARRIDKENKMAGNAFKERILSGQIGDRFHAMEEYLRLRMDDGASSSILENVVISLNSCLRHR